jgi:hypothetical protein
MRWKFQVLKVRLDLNEFVRDTSASATHADQQSMAKTRLQNPYNPDYMLYSILKQHKRHAVLSKHHVELVKEFLAFLPQSTHRLHLAVDFC